MTLVALATPLASVAAGAELQRAILVRNADRSGGQSPFALADQYGRVQRLVEPSPGVRLADYVGQTVRIAHDTGGTLLASQLVLPSRPQDRPTAAPRRSRRAVTADYTQDEPPRVDATQFVAPQRSSSGRLRRIAEPSSSRTSSSRTTPPRTFRRARPRYRLAQAVEDGGRYGQSILDQSPVEAGAANDPTAPIVLEDVLGDEAGDVDLNGRDLQNDRFDRGGFGDGDYDNQDFDGDDFNNGDVTPLEPIPAGDVYYPGDDAYVDRPMTTAAPAADCPTCQPTSAPGATCDQPGGWCGPSCKPASRAGLYGRAEYLLWWFNGFDTPPLAITNANPNAPIVGVPGARIVYGGELVDEERNGVRFTLGAWLDNERDLAIEGDLLLTETVNDAFTFNDPTGTVTLGRPFYNVAPVLGGGVTPVPTNDVQLISFNNQIGGSLSIASQSDFDSFGLRLRTGLCCREIGGCDSCDCNACRGDGPLARLGGGGAAAISRVDFLVGYRYASLEESLLFVEDVRDLSTNASLRVVDRFETENDFHGLDLGVVYEWQTRQWAVELLGRLGVGTTRQEVTITGSNTSGSLGAVVTTPGGLLAQTSNIGSYSNDRFSVLPELSARLAYRLTPNLSVSAAYTLLYWANVVRPGDQIDYSVDGRLASPATVTAGPFSHPRLDLEETSLWAHGLNFGVDYRY